MAMKADYRALQDAADHMVVRRSLRAGGIGSIIFGVIAIGMGAASIKDSPLNAFLVLIGVFLLVEGIWILAAPSPAGMIVQGIALIIVGTWNIGVTISNAVAGAGGGSSLFAVLGVFQILWGSQSFRRYGRFAHVNLQRPPKQLTDWLDATLKAIRAAKPNEAADIVTLTEGAKTWKGQLRPDGAIFVKRAVEDIRLAPRGEVALHTEPDGKEKLQVSLQLGPRRISGLMSVEHVQRYEAWRSQEAPVLLPVAAAAEATARAAQAAPAAPSSIESISLKCVCGHRWKTASQDAGNRTQCPACGTTLYVTPDGRPPFSPPEQT